MVAMQARTLAAMVKVFMMYRRWTETYFFKSWKGIGMRKMWYRGWMNYIVENEEEMKP